MSSRLLILLIISNGTLGLFIGWDNIKSIVSETWNSLFSANTEDTETQCHSTYYNYYYNHTHCTENAYEFQCKDTGCIGPWGRCNGHKDCVDGSDEAQCDQISNQNESKCTIYYNQYFHQHTIMCDNDTMTQYKYPYEQSTDDLKNIVHPLQLQIDHYTEIVQSSQQQINDLIKNIYELQRTVNESNQTLGTYLTKIEKLKEEIEHMESSHKKLQQNYDEIQHINDQYEINTEKHNQTIHNLFAQNQVLQESITNISEQNRLLYSQNQIVHQVFKISDNYLYALIGVICVIICFAVIQFKRYKIQPSGTEDTQIKQLQNNIKFKAHIAIDLQCDGCALAFGYKDEVISYTKYYPVTVRTKPVKVPVQVLLNEKDEIVIIGDTAKSTYLNVKGKAKREWKFFNGLMESVTGDDLIHISGERTKKRSISDPDMQLYLCALNYTQCFANTVFIQVFKKVQNEAKVFLDKLTKDDIKIENEEIQWIVMAPIITVF